MIKWILRLVILLLILVVGSYFFRVEFGRGKLTIQPRSAAERAKFWPSWGDDKPAPAADEKSKSGAAEPEAAADKPTPSAPVRPKDKITKEEKKQLESILEKEL